MRSRRNHDESTGRQPGRHQEDPGEAFGAEASGVKLGSIWGASGLHPGVVEASWAAKKVICYAFKNV